MKFLMGLTTCEKVRVLVFKSVKITERISMTPEKSELNKSSASEIAVSVIDEYVNLLTGEGVSAASAKRDELLEKVSDKERLEVHNLMNAALLVHMVMDTIELPSEEKWQEIWQRIRSRIENCVNLR